MDRFDDDRLAAELRAIRPEPTPEFKAQLDQRAAAGFPRRPSTSRSPFARLAHRLRSLSVGQFVVPAVGTAIALLAVAIVVVALSSSGGGSSSNAANEAVVGMVPGAGESGRAAEETSGGSEGAEATETAEAESSSEESAGGGAHQSHHGGNAPGAVYAPEVPSMKLPEKASSEKSKSSSSASESAEAGEAEAEEAEEAAPEEESQVFAPEVENGPTTASPAAGHRDVERGTSMILGTKPGEVAGASQEVFAAVANAKGYVLHSSVQSGSSGPTAATFSMLIPNRHLNEALAAFSQIGEARQRHDATNDITAPTVSATEELRDSNASIEGLLKELGNAESEEERESVETRLREERRRHAGIRASLEHLHKRASLAEVSLRIVTPRGAGATSPSKGSDGGWNVGDALHDAGNILTVAAGVLLIALAVLAPIALIALLIWLLNRFRVRRLRERALG
jgi:hypothetical protein